MTAKKTELTALHAKLATVLTEYLDDINTADTEALQGNVQVLKLVSSFLKENNITVDLEPDDADDIALKRLEELKVKRGVVKTPLDMMN